MENYNIILFVITFLVLYLIYCDYNKTKPYSTIFNKDNTILIDDSQYHLDYNKHNVLIIHHWLFYEQDDTTLLKIIDFLKSPNIKTNKLPILN